jgi:hypothetical protein
MEKKKDLSFISYLLGGFGALGPYSQHFIFIVTYAWALASLSTLV